MAFTSVGTASTLLFNEGAEKAVISSIFYNPGKAEEASLYLKPDDFYNQNHEMIFKAMISLYEKRENIDPITVFEEVSSLTPKSQLLNNFKALTGLQDYLSFLSGYLPTDKTINVYAKIVKEHRIRRDISKISRELNDLANDSTKKVDQFVEEAQRQILSIELDYSSKNLNHAKVIAERVHAEIYERSMKRREANFGIPSGFKKVDSLIGGFRDSDFIIIGARPSIGKTAFALNIASSIALRNDKKWKVGFFSLEMTSDALIKRIIAAQANIDSFKIQNGILSGHEIKALNDVVNDISNAELYIEDTANISLLTLATQARKLKRFSGIDIIFVDYISLISLETKNIPRHEQVASISKALKELARELKIPIIALSQLTRDTEGREPNLASLRESGALEQDADVVILLHRDKDLKSGSDDELVVSAIDTKVIVAKHRNGPTGRADVLFLPHVVKFVNKEHERDY
ncbi:Replicative DNA helicase [Borrelia miyamotoi]|uniref:Replicative DNA helicase n=1 Tax=Borrelia miyamotoi TaxID=47466 RepID=A0AAP8YUB2_9SPIR|nr:replicative DNA helicase [Borrelia miyamotoi]AHH05307.1 Replicative DNA helicase [Borrelia miyamotoi FR64b]ATQ15068.1 replicative DNA helicase [Borrelia miyamotoi]ATQ16251.1 replicative DNA helicase [Borrelia miyamotoi]ATQ17394.1 replicative DNA helicase [Borrelia miyamotoi]ATQ18104.1 replicative DNA helicase [Borrelia miyamotoi]